MSGIYIHGMEMPQNCICCDLSHEDGWCPAKQVYVDKYSYETCPLSPVPPHGRLGDLDTLQKQIDFARNSGMLGKTAHYKLQKLIKEAPTIIPAEENENG